jgi:hypothetical protein
MLTKAEEEDSWFDIYGGKIHEDAAQREKLISAGVKQNSFFIKSLGLSIPFSQFGIGGPMAAVGAYRDQRRSGVNPGEQTTVNTIMSAMFSLGPGMVSALADNLMAGPVLQIVKLSGQPGDIFGSNPNETKKAAMVNAFTRPVKSMLVPAASMLRQINRVFNGPRTATKDMQTAMVTDIPVLESLFGLPALNVFGEPISAADNNYGFSRFFSSKPKDLDVQWLVETGYTIPGIKGVKADSKKEKELLAVDGDTVDKMSFKQRHEVMKNTAPMVRDIVTRFREAVGTGPARASTQERINNAVNKIRARETLKVLRANSSSVN